MAWVVSDKEYGGAEIEPGTTLDGFHLADFRSTGSIYNRSNPPVHNALEPTAAMPEPSALVSNSSFVRIRALNMRFSGVHFDHVVFEDLTAKDITFTGCRFEHVTFRGKIRGNIWFRPSTSDKDGDTVALVTARHAEVDWAIDIREAEFGEFCDRGGVPLAKVRRDPRHQVIVDPDRIDREIWATVDKTDAPYLWVEHEAQLTVAPMSRRYPRDAWIAVVDELRRLGQVD